MKQESVLKVSHVYTTVGGPNQTTKRKKRHEVIIKNYTCVIFCWQKLRVVLLKRYRTLLTDCLRPQKHVKTTKRANICLCTLRELFWSDTNYSRHILPKGFLTKDRKRSKFFSARARWGNERLRAGAPSDQRWRCFRWIPSDMTPEQLVVQECPLNWEVLITCELNSR